MEENFKAAGIGILISLLVSGNLLFGKYVFLLDSVFGPNPKLFNYWSLGRILFDLILYGISKTIPWLYPKIFIFISVLLGYFCAWIFLKEKLKYSYVFALFYALNPFVYNRLIAGQIILVFSYAFFPLLLKLIEKSEVKRDIAAGAVIAFGIIQLHFIPFALFLVAVFKFSEFFKTKSIAPLKSFGIILGIVLISNLGIAYQLASGGEVSRRFEEITLYQSHSFGPSSSEGLNYLTSLATLHGFWREKSYLQLWDFFPLWFLPFLLILYLSVLGYLSKAKYRNIFLFLALFGLILSAGIKAPVFSGIFKLLFEKVPLFSGYRDSQKFLIFLILAYLYLGSQGLKALPKKAYPLLILLPLYGIPMFFGFQGQVGCADYPRDWYYAQKIIGEEKCIFFPWHRYMDFKWVPNRNKRIENPAYVFFKNAITSKNPEMEGIPPPQDKISVRVREFLLSRKLNTLRELKVKYVILGKEADYKSYLWLANRTELVVNGSTLYLLRVE